MSLGTLLVGQAGGPTSVINASLVGVVREATSAGYSRVIGMRHGVAGLLSGDLIDLAAQRPLALDLLYRTPSSALGATRFRPSADEIALVVERLRSLDVRAFLYIGGNDSADTLYRIGTTAGHFGYEVRCVHVPKTIDNDLVLTDHTPGYGSAARHVATLTRDAGRDTEAMRHTDPIKLLEVPGRNSGWLAAASALARQDDGDAPHLIVPPETGVDIGALLGRVEDVLRRRGCAVVVVAETARDAAGRPIGSDDPTMGAADAFGHRRLSGAASILSASISAGLQVRVRWEKPGTLIRTSGVCLSETDLAEAEMCGRAAVRAALAGATDVTVVLRREDCSVYRCSTDLVPCSSIANHERLLPSEFLTADGYDVTEVFREYAKPLIGGPLPDYGRLELVHP